MKLFVAKLKYKDGDRAYPWTLFAKDYAEAVHRLETGSRSDEFSEIIVREVSPVDAIAHYGRDPSKPDQRVVEHTDIVWQKEQ